MWLCAYIHNRGKEENKESVFEGGEGPENQGRDSKVGWGRFREVVGRLLNGGEEYMAKK